MRTVLLLKLSLLLAAAAVSDGATVRLASCPQGVDGEDKDNSYSNNGVECIRERQVIPREILKAECQEGYELRAGKCHKHLHPSHRATCPTGYARQGDQCYKNCPSPTWRQKFSECLLPRTTLPTKFMTCPEGQHRYEAYCCHPGEDCPDIKCQLSGVPGDFFYVNGICQRPGHAMLRETSIQKPCPEHQNLVWGVCQDPCPESYRPTKGRCELFPCSFDPMTEKAVQCPEGVYLAERAIF